MWSMLDGKSVFPLTESPVAEGAFEEELRGFAAYETVVMKNKLSTIKGKWMAVRNECLVRGLKDPLEHKPRL